MKWSATSASAQEQLFRFARRFFVHSGGTVIDRQSLLEVQLPEGLAQQLESPRKLILCFCPQEQRPGVEYLALGHPLLDRMLALARNRGASADLLVTRGVDPEFLDYALTLASLDTPPPKNATRSVRRLAGALGELQLSDSSVRIVERRLVHQLQMLFCFRVALISDEKQERLVPVLIDALTESPDVIFPLDQAISLRQSRELPPDSYTTVRLYQRACEYLESQLGDDLEHFTMQTRARRDRDLVRIEGYYRGLSQEALDPLRKVFRRMASLSVRSQLTHSFDTQARYDAELRETKGDAESLEGRLGEDLRQLEIEKRRHLREAAARYSVRVEVTLTNLAALRVPRVEYVVRLHGLSRREVTLRYDLLRDRFVELDCECCQQSLLQIHHCSCGDLVCESCHGICAACGKVVCAGCASSSCYLCDSPLCESCAPSCHCGSPLLEETMVCPVCRKAYCDVCRRLGRQSVSSE